MSNKLWWTHSSYSNQSITSGIAGKAHWELQSHDTFTVGFFRESDGKVWNNTLSALVDYESYDHFDYFIEATVSPYFNWAFGYVTIPANLPAGEYLCIYVSWIHGSPYSPDPATRGIQKLQTIYWDGTSWFDADVWNALAAGVKLDPVQGAITWGQQKIIANVAQEGALHVENTHANGFGNYNAGMMGQINFGKVGQQNVGTEAFGQQNQGITVGQKNIATNSGAPSVEGFDPAIFDSIKGDDWDGETLKAIYELIAGIPEPDLTEIAKSTEVTAAKDAIINAMPDIDISTIPEDVLQALVVGDLTVEQVLKVLAAIELGTVTGGGSSTFSYTGKDGTKVTLSGVDEDGNRANVNVEFE